MALVQGSPYEIITDISSGINYKKLGLQDIIKCICSYDVDKAVVLYKDCLVHFGFELTKYITKLHNCQIEVVEVAEKIRADRIGRGLSTDYNCV